MIDDTFTILSRLTKKLVLHWSRGPTRKLASIVSWLTQRLLDRIVVHAACRSYWLHGLTCSIPDRDVVSPVVFLYLYIYIYIYIYICFGTHSLT